MKKNVSFNLENNKVYETYSNNEYDRSQIDSILYQLCYKKLTMEEWNKIIQGLNIYKLTEMVVHVDSINNTKID